VESDGKVSVRAGAGDRIAEAKAAEISAILAGCETESPAQFAPALYLRFIHQTASILDKPFGIRIS
jgi:hypothetical protein